MIGFSVELPSALVLASRVLGVFVFGAAIIGKLRNWTAFVGIVNGYRIIPWGALIVPAAVLVIVFEALVLVSFVTGAALAGGGGLAIALLLGFSIAMAVNIARGELDMDCGCFQSALRQRLSGMLVARNLVLALALAPVLAGQPTVEATLEYVDGIAAGLALAILNAVFAALLSLQASTEAFQKRFA